MTRPVRPRPGDSEVRGTPLELSSKARARVTVVSSLLRNACETSTLPRPCVDSQRSFRSSCSLYRAAAVAAAGLHQHDRAVVRHHGGQRRRVDDQYDRRRGHRRRHDAHRVARGRDVHVRRAAVTGAGDHHGACDERNVRRDVLTAGDGRRATVRAASRVVTSAYRSEARWPDHEARCRHLAPCRRSTGRRTCAPADCCDRPVAVLASDSRAT